MKVTSLIMNILSSILAFSFAGIPMAIGTVGSFFSIGGIYDEKLSRMSFTNLFGSVFVVLLAVAILIIGIMAFAQRKKVITRSYTKLECVAIGLSFLSAIIVYLLYISLEDILQEGALNLSVTFSTLIAVPAVIALILTIIGAVSHPNQITN